MKDALISVLRVLAGTFALLMLQTAILAQEEIKRPPLLVPATADTPSQLIPSGWRAEGVPNEVDLNGDGRLDAAFVISHGFGAPENEPLVTVKHVLVLALRGDDGKLHRSIVSDAAVLDGDEGGAFGDPLDSLSITGDSVVIMHYGGSRDRWGYTHRYRYQNGQWMLVALNFGNTDSLNLEHYDDHDINLMTGLVAASEKGDYEDKPKKPEIGGSYYELEVLPIDEAPVLDGHIGIDEWPGYTVVLGEKDQILRRRQLWRGRDDLSAKLHAVRFGKELFVAAEVTDNQVATGDLVRLVTKKGMVIRPVASKLSPSGRGYVFEAQFLLETVVKASKPRDKYALEEMLSFVDPANQGWELEGLELPVAVEVVDVDRTATPAVRGVLSTRLVGSPYNGAFRIFRKGTLVLDSDIKQ
jgi:hypothetical protein